MTALTGEILAELIAKRLACLVQLRKLGERQSALIEDGDIGSLLRLLSAKNQLIVALQSLEHQLAPFHSQAPEERPWASSAAREACADQARQCRTHLDEIMRMERENEQKMACRRDQVAGQLRAAQSADTARRAYQAQQGSGLSIIGKRQTASSERTRQDGDQHLDVSTNR